MIKWLLGIMFESFERKICFGVGDVLNNTLLTISLVPFDCIICNAA
jgi:hypothetical protein